MVLAGTFETSLLRSVVISLFTWRRAGPDDPVDDDELYGWWGDTYPTVADDRIGSRLWLLRRVRLNADTRRDAVFYAQEALQWLIDDEHVRQIDITTEQVGINRLNLGVVLTLTTGQTVRLNASDQWQVIYAV